MSRVEQWRFIRKLVASSSPVSLPWEVLHHVLRTVTVIHTWMRLAAQIAFAEKPAFTAPTITNVVQTKCAVMATANIRALTFGPEVL